MCRHSPLDPGPSLNMNIQCMSTLEVSQSLCMYNNNGWLVFAFVLAEKLHIPAPAKLSRPTSSSAMPYYYLFTASPPDQLLHYILFA